MTEEQKKRLREIVWVDPGRMSGAPCFRGSRIPVGLIFDDLRCGYTIKDVLDAFPDLTRQEVEDFLALTPALVDEAIVGVLEPESALVMR